ncbi:MAG: hypothetical protein C0467_19415 [Planctomycetaceae bacterium]|nr:hypothetical protein [Planctomycetaceae bacterium]
MGLIWIIIAIVVISTVVGAVSKLLNNLNEVNNAGRARVPNQPAGGRAGGGGGVVRQTNSDMDRFLAEIDRLRKKTADAPPPQQNQGPTVPVVQPVRQPDRARTRVVAELAEAPQRTDGGFTQSFPTAIAPQRVTELPVPAALTAPPSGTGAPATRVTRLATRPRPVAKTPFAKNLTGLLASGQGLAMAIVLQEVLGPPKIKKRG